MVRGAQEGEAQRGCGRTCGCSQDSVGMGRRGCLFRALSRGITEGVLESIHDPARGWPRGVRSRVLDGPM